MALAKFLASTNGRILRIVVGIVLIAVALLVSMDTAPRVILIVIGLIPLVAGALDLCLIAPLFGLPLAGKEIRAK